MMTAAEIFPGALEAQIDDAVSEAKSARIAERIQAKDASVWTSEDAVAKMINNSLGWLNVAGEMLGVVGDLREFADEVRREFRHVMVCGMGGSSLCPEVLARTFGPQPGYPELLVLDSTDPDVIAAFAERIEVEKCLFVIASKSGTTTEPNVFYKFWYDRAKSGKNFVVITDPGSPLVETARTQGSKRIFLNKADIGGRYSALSYFGMLPAVLMGVEIGALLERAKNKADIGKAIDEALRLGVAIGELANAGRDKLTFVIDPKLATLGLWIEQLIAESTGKQGKGILPVVGEPLGDPSVYGDDRVFVSISLGKSEANLESLARVGHPVIHRELNDLYDLGAEFFAWEFATACAGWRLGINPFDQPNVQEAKDATKELLAE
ncbi:MAG TPA: hypothetical protein VGW58_18415, partial [Pyrinomonadaceae bacterium]|nr:hypothetical protein [Pyrinomonadaceae bacterium]